MRDGDGDGLEASLDECRRGSSAKQQSTSTSNTLASSTSESSSAGQSTERQGKHTGVAESLTGCVEPFAADWLVGQSCGVWCGTLSLVPVWSVWSV